MENTTVSARVHFAAAHRILGYQGDCAFLHGHTYQVEVTVRARYGPDSLGMVVDFRRLKRLLAEFVGDNLDHRVILSAEDPLVEVLRRAGQRVFVMPPGPDGRELSTTAEHIAWVIRRGIEQGLPADVRVESVRVYETPDAWAQT